MCWSYRQDSKAHSGKMKEGSIYSELALSRYLDHYTFCVSYIKGYNNNGHPSPPPSSCSGGQREEHCNREQDTGSWALLHRHYQLPGSS